MHTLYGTRGSGSAIVEAALEIAQLPYRTVRASEWESDSAQDDLRRFNPLGQIPTLLLEGGGVLTESAAILIHLGLAHPGSKLLPADATQRAQVLRGLVYIAANCYSAISIDDYPERYLADPDDATCKRLKTGTRALLNRRWEAFADTFAATPWLSGAELGALDLMAAIVSRWSGARAHLQQARPEFDALVQRIGSHPVLAGVIARHWPAKG